MKRIFILTVTSVFTFASGVSSADQSLSIAWSKSENYLDGLNNRYFYEPLTSSIYYSVGLSDYWSLGASLWRSEAEEDIDTNQFRLEEESSGGGAIISYLQGDWSFNFGFNLSKTDVEVRSPISITYYEENGENSDVYLSFDYVYSLEQLDIMPSFGIGSQKFKQESNGILSTTMFSREEQQSSTYTFVDLAFSTWFELSQTSLIQPSIQMGWTEALSGESSLTSRAARRNVPLRQNSLNSDTHAEGSGYLGISLALFIDDFQFRLAHSKTLALDINTETSSVEIGILF